MPTRRSALADSGGLGAKLYVLEVLYALRLGQTAFYDSLRTAVMTTRATSLGCEIMTTCEAPSTSVTVAPMRP